ncbi:hypothetical protein CLIB1444_04S07712 [[Candida] jaroonii]|uniref:Uncharacterized protein n=1 Tax=[Candida] jaroonii TaxID=467808 RepID=A0ACA9Y7C6_9ASCO|nr:hypothetical protein CLIB1444_04S07712 [[Candida] jaroonii]
MKNLIIISNIPRSDFNSKVPALKALVNNDNIVNWSSLPFLQRIIIICNSELNSFKLLNFLIDNKNQLNIQNYELIIKENFTKISNNLEVNNPIDLNYENKLKPNLKLDTKITNVFQLPSPESPSITISMSQ